MRKNVLKISCSFLIMVTIILSSTIGLFAQVHKADQDYLWLKNRLHTDFLIYDDPSSDLIGLEINDVGGKLKNKLDDGDIIISAGKTFFSFDKSDKIFKNFRKEVRKALRSRKGILSVFVIDVNSGNIRKVNVRIK